MDKRFCWAGCGPAKNGDQLSKYTTEMMSHFLTLGGKWKHDAGFSERHCRNQSNFQNLTFLFFLKHCRTPSFQSQQERVWGAKMVYSGDKTAGCRRMFNWVEGTVRELHKTPARSEIRWQEKSWKGAVGWQKEGKQQTLVCVLLFQGFVLPTKAPTCVIRGPFDQFMWWPKKVEMTRLQCPGQGLTSEMNVSI